MKEHSKLGRKTVHHLVPRIRIRDYYGDRLFLPKNKLKLWSAKHAFWHQLFGNRSINEIIRYLARVKKDNIRELLAWEIVFKQKTFKQARLLLIRVRNIIRKSYRNFEFDPLLKSKVKRCHKKPKKIRVDIFINRQFSHA